jgi:FkbM family methyltransferase
MNHSLREWAGDLPAPDLDRVIVATRLSPADPKAMTVVPRRLLSWLPPSAAYYIYTVILKPKPLRRMAQSVIKRLIPPTIDFRGTRIALNQDDAIVSGSLALGCYETFVTDVLEALLRPGMTFFDVGANIGIYTALGARIVGPAGRVVAVEPGPANVALIQKTVSLNGFENVTVAARAAGDRAEQVSLYLCGDNPADHRLHDPTGRRRQVTVETVTLDALAVECGVVRADVVKIDTQGSEAAVFAGMAQLLAAKPPPVIVAEFWPWGLTQAGANPRELLSRITAAGFLVYEIDGDRRTVLPRPDLDALAGLNLERQHVNLLLCQDPQTVADMQVLLTSRGR